MVLVQEIIGVFLIEISLYTKTWQAKHMADWKHKLAHWTHMGEYTPPLGMEDEVIIDGELIGLTLVDWLDLQCEGGWELFDIHLNNGSRECLFRKKI